MVTENFRSGHGHRTHVVPKGRLWLCMFASLSVCLFWCPIAWAQPEGGDNAAPAAADAKQQYQQLPVNADLKKAYYSDVSPVLREGRFAAGQQPAFDEFYHQYYLSRWTEPENIANLPAFRKDLRISHLGRKSSATQVHDHLVAMVLKFMQNLVDGRFHPAVQLNAMLTIGELNSVEQPPTPLAEALPVLFAAVENADLSDAVRAAAMVGIQRHVALGISDPDVRRTLATALLNLAEADLPTGIRRAGREWILGQTLETLAEMGSVGNGNAVVKAMLKAVASDQLSLSTRSIAAGSLGRLSYAGATGIHPAEAAPVLGRFLVDACTEELDKAKAADEPAPPRRLQQCLAAVDQALKGDGKEDHKGLASLTTPQNQQALVDDLQKAVQSASEQLDDWQEGNDPTDTVKKLRGDLETLLKEK